MHDDKKRRDIRLLLAAEVPLERVAELTGVSLSTVQRVGKGRQGRASSRSRGSPPDAVRGARQRWRPTARRSRPCWRSSRA